METTATTGQGIEQILLVLDSEALCSINGLHPFEWVDEILLEVRRQEEVPGNSFTSRTALLTTTVCTGTLLHFENYFGPWLGWPTTHGLLSSVLERVGSTEILTSIIATVGGFLLPVLLPLLIASRVDCVFSERFGVWARKPVTGAIILISTLSLMYQFVGNIGAQSLVEILEGAFFGKYVIPLLQASIPNGFVYDLLVGQYGVISVGLTYSVAIVLPVISTFFIAFSFLEDSGYLPRLTVLCDRLLRAMGLNGKALLPMVLGLGCVTMATMTTRILNTRKERVIATLLLALAVPCSAQLGVILGIISGISLSAVAVVFATVFLQLIVVGTIASRLLPGRRSPFILELPPIRNPLWPNIFRKTHVRVKWFLREALPLFLLGTLLLFITDRLAILETLIASVEPVVSGLLDLPRQTATIFFMGFLRRDYGAAGLFDMVRQGQLDFIQIAVSLTVMTLFVPCIANFFVIIKEHGFRIALAMILFISFYSVVVGAILNLLLRGLIV
jgi:ferrous iron transport protein B